MPNPGPATNITEHPIGGGGSPAYLGTTGALIGFYQDPYGGGAVARRAGPIQQLLTVSAATGYMVNFTSLSQGSPTQSAQTVSATQITISGAPQVSTADIMVINKQLTVSNFASGFTARIASVSANANIATLSFHNICSNVSGTNSVTPAGDTYIMTAFRGPLVNTVTLSPAVVPANSVAEQTFTVSGVYPGMLVALQKPTEQANLAVGQVRVPVSNQLAVQFLNIGNTAITPTANEVYSYTALLGVQGVSPILIAGVNLGGATSGIASVITVSGGALTPASVNVTGINASDFVVGVGQNVEAMSAATSVALVKAYVSAANILSLTFLNANTNSASITALSTDTWMIPILRPNADAPMTIYNATVTSVAIGPNTISQVPITVPGLTVTSAVLVQKPSFTTGIAIVGASVTNAGTSIVSVLMANPTSNTIVTPTETYLVGAFKPVLGTGHYIQQLVAPVGVQGIALTNEMRNVLAGTGLMQGF